MIARLETLLSAVERTFGSPDRDDPSATELRRVFSRLVLRRCAEHLLTKASLEIPRGARLFDLDEADRAVEREVAWVTEARAAVAELLNNAPAEASSRASAEAIPELLGATFQWLLALEVRGDFGRRRLSSGRGRRATGSFFTPSALTGPVIGAALTELRALNLVPTEPLALCDPSCGAGAFLVASARALAASRGFHADDASAELRAVRRHIVETSLYGVDVDPLAVAVCELALWAYVRDPDLPPAYAGRLRTGDAVTGRSFNGPAGLDSDAFALDWGTEFPERRERGFDLVIGNPPWIAYAGRATQPLTPERRAFFSRYFAAFRGYPTLHAVFVERAAELAPSGVVALVVPSPIADLDGYRRVRSKLRETHEPCEPMLEFGQDAFAEVTQPCFALIARPRLNRALALIPSGSCPPLEAPFRLNERSLSSVPARTVEVPEALARLKDGPRLPPDMFREMGLQTTRVVTETLLKRASEPDERFSYPLLEGREINEFRVGPPRLYLYPDEEVLSRVRCRLRSPDEYRKVSFVVRQTAKAPIAALHTGLPFRNTLLAGFETAELPAPLLVGLLNSSLYRAFHLSTQRDARQAVFPQVKIAHLRALPRPPSIPSDRVSTIRALTLRATEQGATDELRRALDDAVFELFDFSERDRAHTLRFLAERAPTLAGTSTNLRVPESRGA